MRKLNTKEIKQLTEQGCQAQDWSLVRVHKYFDASRCQQVHFIGQCEIGDNRGGRPSEEEPSYDEPYQIGRAHV